MYTRAQQAAVKNNNEILMRMCDPNVVVVVEVLEEGLTDPPNLPAGNQSQSKSSQDGPAAVVDDSVEVAGPSGSQDEVRGSQTPGDGAENSSADSRLVDDVG